MLQFFLRRRRYRTGRSRGWAASGLRPNRTVPSSATPFGGHLDRARGAAAPQWPPQLRKIGRGPIGGRDGKELPPLGREGSGPGWVNTSSAAGAAGFDKDSSWRKLSSLIPQPSQGQIGGATSRCYDLDFLAWLQRNFLFCGRFLKIRRRMREYNPPTLRLQLEEASMKVINPNQLQLLLQSVNRRAPFGERDYWLIVLLAHTGLRVAELVSLDVGQVFHAGQPRQVLFLTSDQAKGARSRAIPLNQSARQASTGVPDHARLLHRTRRSAPGCPTTSTHQHPPGSADLPGPSREVRPGHARYSA